MEENNPLHQPTPEIPYPERGELAIREFFMSLFNVAVCLWHLFELIAEGIGILWRRWKERKKG